MTMNLRSDMTFVQDDGWYAASNRYDDFIRRHQNLHILFLELGVGANTPVIIKYPFWQMTAQDVYKRQPMRQLGSFFHIAMNGMAASDKIFRLLDLEEAESQQMPMTENCSISCSNLHFSYEPDREILHGIAMDFPPGSFTALVGESGCGKSTVASILMGRNKGYAGSVSIGGAELRDIDESSLLQNITYISHQSYLFKGTVRDLSLIHISRYGTLRRMFFVLILKRTILQQY